MLGNRARNLLKQFLLGVEEWQHSRQIVPVADQPVQTPTVYFLTPDHSTPSGGILVIYRHVDILNAAGIRAFVLHQRRGFRCAWFKNQTQVTDAATARIGRGDLLVVPEPDVDIVCKLPAGTRHVIFNQNGHLTWRWAAEQVGHHYATSADLAGIITVSDHSADLLRYTFGGRPVRRIHLGIDPALFHPGGDSPRPQRIGYMPRRGQADAERVLHILRARGVLDGWEVVPLDGLTHLEVAECLRTTRIFLAFTHQEGFGLPAAEAMACGNYVVGCHGFGGREFFLPAFSTPVETGDLLGFARAVEDAIVHDRAEPGWCLARGREASAFILGKYSPDRERNEVVGTYARLLGPFPVPNLHAGRGASKQHGPAREWQPQVPT